MRAEELEAMLNDPHKAWELWEKVQEKFQACLDNPDLEPQLRAECDLLNLPEPDLMASDLNHNYQPKEGLQALLDQCPELDLATLDNLPPLRVALDWVSTVGASRG